MSDWLRQQQRQLRILDLVPPGNPDRKRLRAKITRSGSAPDGRRVVSFGARIGFWPCLGGPFVQVTIATRRYTVWVGRPSASWEGEQ